MLLPDVLHPGDTLLLVKARAELGVLLAIPASHLQYVDRGGVAFRGQKRIFASELVAHHFGLPVCLRLNSCPNLLQFAYCRMIASETVHDEYAKDLLAYNASFFSVAALLVEKDACSFDFRFPLDSDQRRSLPSSVEGVVQSSVAPPSEEDGTGWSGMTPMDGLKSTSDSPERRV